MAIAITHKASDNKAHLKPNNKNKARTSKTIPITNKHVGK